jgi:hypothetical protein
VLAKKQVSKEDWLLKKSLHYIRIQQKELRMPKNSYKMVTIPPNMEKEANA